MALLLTLTTGCQKPSQAEVPMCLQDVVGQQSSEIVASTPNTLSLPLRAENLPLLQESWIAYRQRFIQEDGRVIDREDGDRSTSEGQAYAMLRAVLINDPGTFVRTLNWAEQNLMRKGEDGDRLDQLWSWKWGRTTAGRWTTIDSNFASDADIDAVTALIFASRRWGCSEYLELAKVKLTDIWNYSTAEISPNSRILLPGPAEAFWNQPDTLILNPSYFAPYAFRLFAQVDPERNWMSLVDSSYQLLEASSDVSAVGLPSDWISLNPQTAELSPVSDSNLQSQYGFDAYRVWWRVALDAAWFQEPQAEQYLRQHLAHLEQFWQDEQRIPARFDMQGRAIADYEATAQYATLYAAFVLTQPQIAEQIYQQKLEPQYRQGFWDNNSAYYTQNLVWFGLLPPAPPSAQLMQASGS
ncbi:MAG: glycosyl hydrolase [Leptolyngbyaceae cyanobacterium RM2_2_4]|nr:glycosyl hydrolase [Leptolyngbyaceae cyanobacterium SM1_4_3]NJN90909.1 glycosyl hydrolase [Leptolyngbyaceae cyanobacterium SL_5_14]NJO49814.1 glycosyl hydrolase [Leptolyngbyaceae cyanobacterium RM2_2_4]